MKIEIKNRWNNKVIICGEYESIKDCLEKNRGADLRGASLGGADLRGAYLGGADLGGAKNYVSSHDFWLEIIRRQPIETFTEQEWAIIGAVIVHRMCWDTIKNRYNKRVIPIFKKLSDIGFTEWIYKYKEVLTEKE